MVRTLLEEPDRETQRAEEQAQRAKAQEQRAEQLRFELLCLQLELKRFKKWYTVRVPPVPIPDGYPVATRSRSATLYPLLS